MEKIVDLTLDVALQIESDYADALEAALISGMDGYIVQFSSAPPLQVSLDFTKEIMRQLHLVWSRAIHNTGTLVLEDIRSSAKNSFLFDRFVVEYIATHGRQRAALIVQNTATQLIDRVKRDQRNGVSLLAALKNLAAEIPTIARVKSKIILATEVHSAAQFASQKAAENSGLDLLKIWNSIPDERTRRFGLFGRQDAFNHLVMNQTRVSLSQSFAVPRKVGGYERLYFPGDPVGSAGNIINCRCVQTYERIR